MGELLTKRESHSCGNDRLTITPLGSHIVGLDDFYLARKMTFNLFGPGTGGWDCGLHLWYVKIRHVEAGLTFAHDLLRTNARTFEACLHLTPIQVTIECHGFAVSPSYGWVSICPHYST